MIKYLPWDSAYKLAISDDEELARQEQAEAEGQEYTRKPPLPITQWDTYSELRASILDGLSMVARTIIAVNTPHGKQVPDFPRQQRPETAAQRLERRQRDMVMSMLEAHVAGLNTPWEPPNSN